MNVFQTITRQICYVNSFYNFKTFTATATNSWNENIIIECKQYHAVNIFFRTWLRRHGGVIRWYRSDYFGKYSVSKLIRADGGPLGYNTPYAILWRHPMETFSALLAICTGNVNSPYKGQWRRTLMFSLICAWINGLVNNRKAGDLRRHRAH